jgi:hypothetical protein
MSKQRVYWPSVALNQAPAIEGAQVLAVACDRHLRRWILGYRIGLVIGWGGLVAISGTAVWMLKHGARPEEFLWLGAATIVLFAAWLTMWSSQPRLVSLKKGHLLAVTVPFDDQSVFVTVHPGDAGAKLKILQMDPRPFGAAADILKADASTPEAERLFLSRLLAMRAQVEAIKPRAHTVAFLWSDTPLLRDLIDCTGAFPPSGGLTTSLADESAVDDGLLIDTANALRRFHAAADEYGSLFDRLRTRAAFVGNEWRKLVLARYAGSDARPELNLALPKAQPVANSPTTREAVAKVIDRVFRETGSLQQELVRPELDKVSRTRDERLKVEEQRRLSEVARTNQHYEPRIAELDRELDDLRREHHGLKEEFNRIKQRAATDANRLRQLQGEKNRIATDAATCKQRLAEVNTRLHCTGPVEHDPEDATRSVAEMEELRSELKRLQLRSSQVGGDIIQVQIRLDENEAGSKKLEAQLKASSSRVHSAAEQFEKLKGQRANELGQIEERSKQETKAITSKADEDNARILAHIREFESRCSVITAGLPVIKRTSLEPVELVRRALKERNDSPELQASTFRIEAVERACDAIGKQVGDLDAKCAKTRNHLLACRTVWPGRSEAEMTFLSIPFWASVWQVGPLRLRTDETVFSPGCLKAKSARHLAADLCRVEFDQQEFPALARAIAETVQRVPSILGTNLAESQNWIEQLIGTGLPELRKTRQISRRLHRLATEQLLRRLSKATTRTVQTTLPALPRWEDPRPLGLALAFALCLIVIGFKQPADPKPTATPVPGTKIALPATVAPVPSSAEPVGTHAAPSPPAPVQLIVPDSRPPAAATPHAPPAIVAPPMAKVAPGSLSLTTKQRGVSYVLRKAADNQLVANGDLNDFEASLHELTPDRYRLLFSRKGWPDDTHAVEVRAGTSTNFAAVFPEVTISVLSAPPDLQPWINGQKQAGWSAPHVETLPPGRYSVRTRAGAAESKEFELELLRNGAHSQLRYYLLESSPAGAGVFAGDDKLGTTPYLHGTATDLPVQLTLKLPDHRDANVTLDPREPHRKVELALQVRFPSGEDLSWTNSLGMKFSRVPGANILFCVWETRVADYESFVRDGGRQPTPPKFEQATNHPVVNVDLPGARAFCEWLTTREQQLHWIATRQRYRLPTDLEWSWAAGLMQTNRSKTKNIVSERVEPEGAQLETPRERSRASSRSYLWGVGWPPPLPLQGNFFHRSPRPGQDAKDGFRHTAPVGEFPANKFGLHDLSGNVWEWCDSVFDTSSAKNQGTLRGGSWAVEVTRESAATWLLAVGFRRRGDGYGIPPAWVPTRIGQSGELKPVSLSDEVGFRVVLEP